MNQSQQDISWMRKAIALAWQGRFTTAPNPNVGCVLVKDQQLIGEGFHLQAGGPHAEVLALQMAGAQARGATAYVTLEPCCHFGRTAPCADALIAAGVARVVVAMTDPNPQVSGAGIIRLQQAGIAVTTDVCTAEARVLNPGFLSRMLRKRPWVRLKLAASLDGRIALKNGQSKWLTGAEARADVQLWRAQSCAILSTAQTVLADQARLNVRGENITPLQNGQLRQPLRIILDRQRRLSGNEALFQQAGDILLLHGASATARVIQSEYCKVEQRCLNETAAQLFDMHALWDLLTGLALNHLFIEAGSQLASACFNAGWVDELILYQAPILLGPDALPMLQFPELQQLTAAPRFAWQQISPIGSDLRLIAQLSKG